MLCLCVRCLVTAKTWTLLTNEVRTTAMKNAAQDVKAFRLLSGQPNERNGNEAEKFSDECWEKGLRLDKSPSVHYQLLMETIRWTLIPQQK